ncbi:LicD family protein [Lacticaseibacillus sp. N501-2]|uniref:LicD family protein n=1 Tax=Lacticaseibacillus salsurae TaxID=3367729 RepID=UPI0038B30A02
MSGVPITDIEEFQHITLNILSDFNKLCEEFQLQYYLAYGTLIGALRHKGFIPWDDDIDIIMPREEYNRFVTICKSRGEHRYSLLSTETCKNYKSPYPKYIDNNTELIQQYGFRDDIPMGIYIDIFILDGCSSDLSEAHKVGKTAAKLFHKWVNASQSLTSSNSGKLISTLKWLKNTPYRMKGSKRYLHELQDLSAKYPLNSSRYCSVLIGGYDTVWPVEYFQSGRLTSFEELNCPIPLMAEKILSDDYGNYLELPPLEKRKPHHHFEAHWK